MSHEGPRAGHDANDASIPRPPLDDRRLGGLVDRWEAARRSPVVAALAVCAVAGLAGIAWFRQSAPSSAAAEPVGTIVAPSSSVVVPLATTTSAASREIVVHVAGAVADPGIVTLATPARVIDAIEAAGGAETEADLDRLNLAALLDDAQRVLVARVGDPPSPSLPEGGASTAGEVPEAGAQSHPIDLNLATAAELEALPGVGSVIAEAIVAERDRLGGFTSVGQLRSVSGIGDAKLEQIRDLVVV